MKSNLDSRLLDRLIDGELNSTDRRETLLKIDSTPGGWRQCALAFLEAQEFSLAAKTLTTEHASIPIGPAIAPTQHALSTAPRRWVLAASILALSFLAGFAARGRSGLDRPGGPSLETKIVGSAVPTSGAIADRRGIKVIGTANPAHETPSSSVIPEYVRSQWERQGYQIEQKRKLISMDIDGGGRVTIPFDDVEFRFVGQPTY